MSLIGCVSHSPGTFPISSPALTLYQQSQAAFSHPSTSVTLAYSASMPCHTDSRHGGTWI